jgi:class 3 adenylate cyclase/predicted ATPase
MDVSTWLRDLGLEDYAQAFQANHIDAKVLPRLTADDLTALGITSVGHRRRLLDAIAALDEGRPTATAEPIAATTHPIQAERRQLTVLFCDLVGSTELAARLDPEDLRGIMGEYQRCAAAVVERFEGHLARFLGDGVLAYFGWPRAHEDDAERAVRAGLQLVEDVARLKPRAEVRLQARVGVATGYVVVGDLISEGISDKDAVSGDTPSLAARLQAVAGPGCVVISQPTRRLVGGLFELADLGPQRLKGFTEPVAAWRVEGEGRAEGRFEALHGERLTPLVGRQHELGILLERWAWAKDGDGQVVLLSGEPGIGKSRVIRALRERLEGELYIPLSHYCSPYHVNSPLHPVIGLLERATRIDRYESQAQQLARLEAVLGRACDRLDEVVPLVATLLGVPTGDRYPALTLTPEAQKGRTLQALVDQLAGLAAQQPVLALYEDVHWIDPSTLDLLGMAIERIRELPVLALITFRPEFQPPWTGQAHVTTLTMSRLGRRQGADLVSRVTGDKPLPAPVLEQIVARADGVPLFVEELTKTVLESGLLADKGDHYELSGPLPPFALPATLHDSLMARLDRLAPVKEVAQIGAAIGREFRYDLLAAVAPLPEEQLLQALRQLVAAELIFARGTPPQATYSFKHALVQEAAHGSLLRGRRQQLHARIAAVLEQRFPGIPESQPELLAHHYTEAGFTEPAIDYWRKAGQRASARSAPTEAVGHLTKGLELLSSLPVTPERHRQELDLQTALGGALIAAKGFSAPVQRPTLLRARQKARESGAFEARGAQQWSRETGAAFARARELCSQIDDPAQLFPVLFGQWLFHLLRAELAVTREVAEEMLRLAQEHADSAGLVIAHRATGTSLFWLGRFGEARAHLEQVLALYDPERHAELAYLYNFDPRVIGLDFLSLTLFALGYPEQAQRRNEEALALAKQLSHLVTLAAVLQHTCMIHQFLGERGAVRQGAEELWSLATGQGFPFWGAHATFVRAWAEAQERQSEQDLVQLRCNLDVIRSSGAVVIVPYYLGLLAETHGRRGDLPAALDLLGEALVLVEQTGECWFAAELHRVRGELLSAAGDQDAAEAALRMAVALAREQDAKWWELRAASSLGRLCHARGRPAEARALLAPLCGWFTEGFDTADLKDAKALLDELA